jgi:hypothetical protein
MPKTMVPTSLSLPVLGTNFNSDKEDHGQEENEAEAPVVYQAETRRNTLYLVKSNLELENYQLVWRDKRKSFARSRRIKTINQSSQKSGAFKFLPRNKF